jgi:hypothetical protein
VIAKTITYKDLDGKDVTEDFHFNLTRAELVEMNFSEFGSLFQTLNVMIEMEDMGAIISSIKLLLRLSVGKRAEDGKRFIKNQDITDAFMQSNAYSTMLYELMTNAESSIELIKGIMPPEMLQQVEDLDLPADMTQMSKEQLLELMRQRETANNEKPAE